MAEWITRIVAEVGGQQLVWTRRSKACRAERHELCEGERLGCACPCEHGRKEE